MRAVVTGGFGFIGRNLIDRLLDDGWDVICIDDGRNSTAAIPERERLTIWPQAVERADVLVHVDAIYHLASPVGPVGVLRRGGVIAREVIACAGKVAEWALHSDCPLIDVSTSEVYGSGGTDHEDDPCVFKADTSARKEYAVAKLAAETMLRNTEGLDVRIIRPFNVAGPGQSAYGGFVLPRFIQQARLGLPLSVYQPGTQRRAFTHVFDIVEGLILAYYKGKPGAVYNLGNAANAVTVLRLAAMVRDIVRSDSPTEIVDPADLWGPDFREAPDKLPVADRARLDLGWQPVHDLAKIIRDAAAR